MRTKKCCSLPCLEGIGDLVFLLTQNEIVIAEKLDFADSSAQGRQIDVM